MSKLGRILATIAVMFLVVVLVGCGQDPPKTVATTVATTTNQAEKAPLVQPRPEQEKPSPPKKDEGAELLEWAKEHVSTAEESCATYKKKLYASGLEKEQKDLLWGAVLVSSEYCWKVDVPKPKPEAKAK